MLASPQPISPIPQRNDQLDKSPSSPETQSLGSKPHFRAQSVTYPRSLLLSIGLPLKSSSLNNPNAKKVGKVNNDLLKPENSRRLSNFIPILRESITPAGTLLDTNPNPGSEEPESTFSERNEYFDDELDLYDGQPISKDLPIPQFSQGDLRHPCDRSRFGGASISRGNSYDSYTETDAARSEYLFTSNSLDQHRNKLPILVDFNNPFGNPNTLDAQNTTTSSSPNEEEQFGKNKGVHIPISGRNHPLQNLPKSVNSSSTSLNSLSLGMRLGPREDLVDSSLNTLGGGRLSRSNSNSSISSIRSGSLGTGTGAGAGRALSFSKDKNDLNPFAPPFPLPTNPSSGVADQAHQPQLIHPKPINHENSKAITISNPASNSSSPEIPVEGSLPLPKSNLPGLPASLPPRPSPLPPVFVKRESAALPQPMALPDIAPMGKDWMGENSLSGNEKRRRRASQVGNGLGLPGGGISRSGSPLGMGGRSAPSSRRGSFVGDTSALHGGNSISRSNSPFGSNASTVIERRPDRLVKLGQRFRSDSPGRDSW